jgi:ribosome maturation factor RimP
VKGDHCERVREATGDTIRGLSLELVDVEITRERGRTFVRLYIDRPGGVTVDDCAKTSELVGKVLEREETVRGPYVLEVMSPGIDRPLRSREDFSKSVGKRVKVKLDESVEGRRSYVGLIDTVGDESFRLSFEGGSVDLGFEDVAFARLEPELPW